MDILVIGQSNASNWFHDITFSASAPGTLSWRGGGWQAVRGEGAVAFTATLASATGEQVRVLNAAEGNTSLTPVQGANWLATGPSSLYGKMLAAAAASGLRPDAIIWIQGERDAQFRVGTDAYRAGLETLYQRLQHDFGDVPLLMQPLVLAQTGKDAIVAAQQAFAGAHADVTLVAPSVELLTRDLLHFTPAGYNVLGDMMARAVLAELSLPAAPDASRVYAGSGDDTLSGTSANDVLLGEQGNDSLVGGAGADILSGGTGSDTLVGGAGADHLEGGTGADFFVFSGGADGADRIYDFASGIDKLVFPSLAGVTVSGSSVYHNGRLVVTVAGPIAAGDLVAAAPPPPAPANLHIVGTSRADTLAGGDGHDTLDGGLGDDTYIVTAGDQISDTGGTDRVLASATWKLGPEFEHLTLTGDGSFRAIGNALANCIVGNAGDNVLFGCGGIDTLTGGAGCDAFKFRRPGADRIADFAPGTDKIWIDDAWFSSIGATGNFAVSDVRFWAAPGAVRGHDANDRVVYNLSTGNLYYDADGSGRGAAVLIATLEGAPVISAADVAVI